MKLKKTYMTRFDYIARTVFVFMVVMFLIMFFLVEPQLLSYQNQNAALTNEISELEQANATLQRENDELLNPVTTMENDEIE
jgi:p-aminobenzoyl-glutamate transporter AbgT